MLRDTLWDKLLLHNALLRYPLMGLPLRLHHGLHLRLHLQLTRFSRLSAGRGSLYVHDVGWQRLHLQLTRFSRLSAGRGSLYVHDVGWQRLYLTSRCNCLERRPRFPWLGSHEHRLTGKRYHLRHLLGFPRLTRLERHLLRHKPLAWHQNLMSTSRAHHHHRLPRLRLVRSHGHLL